MTSRLIRRGKGVVDSLSGMEDKGTVLQEGDVVWSVMLNQTDVSYGVKGHNKFYSFQIIIDNSDGHRAYVFFKWGRVGAVRPQRKLHGPCTKDAAKEMFIAKFVLKTENEWPLVQPFVPVKGKYTLIELDYSGNDDCNADQDDSTTVDKSSPVPPSSLPLSVQTFVKMICDVDLIAQEMTEMHLDLKRMPLGKLSKGQLAKGYAILHTISDTLNAITDMERSATTSAASTVQAAASTVPSGTRRRSSRAKAATASAVKSQVAKCKAKLKALTSEFYTLIPHNFGMSLPPVIDSVSELKLKLDLLEVMADVELTHKMLETQRTTDANPVDAHYRALGVTLVPIDAMSPEFARIQEYIKLTHAPTHRQYTLHVDAVHALDRDKHEGGSNRRATDTPSTLFESLENHQLLWHGSRLSNIASILTKGLRIAPPEAPSTGYMFGKGVYFADVASKAANYCWASTNQTKGVLILTEVALGTSVKAVEAHEYSFEALQQLQCHSVLGVGRMTPTKASHFVSDDGVKMPMGMLEPTDADGTLLYNEYVVYRTDQMRMRYAVSVTFDFN
ncbi:hypothetical protein, variant 1 [Aphanomyces invadans]|uniref:Poly [ADP-ribose] polymerase n=1 Tax=Aphanomyces invadans TaxID=157072 RepID=A0A024TFV3_9STRA|nr:hypothetical protein, variant 1 [Aphanomyces invadans]ETV92242.1 hypothetical protein, variant 1 [Aphanomyces invadans]|eukprot:XP_008879206.1 hypothetical protein, variant 1 [Aphanomyces invadans]